MEILEVKSAITEMKDLLESFSVRAGALQSKLKRHTEDCRRKTVNLKTKTQGQRRTKKSTKIQGHVGYSQKSNIYVTGIPKGRKERIVQKNI